MKKVVGRDPVFVTELGGMLVLAISLFFNLNPTVQGLVNAVVMALVGVVSAWLVSAEKALPLIAGLARAVIALMVGLGIEVPANVQAGAFAVIGVFVAFMLRSQVVAPVPAVELAPPIVPPITRSTGGHV